VQQWDINGHKIGSPVPGQWIAFSPDGTQFVSWKEETVTIRNTDSKTTIVEFDQAVKLTIAVSLPMEGSLL
jgi:hypothetical protein